MESNRHNGTVEETYITNIIYLVLFTSLHRSTQIFSLKSPYFGGKFFLILLLFYNFITEPSTR
jgi:hypothetical protein